MSRRLEDGFTGFTKPAEAAGRATLTMTCVAAFPEFQLCEGAVTLEGEEVCVRAVILSPEVQDAYDMASFFICPNQDKSSTPEDRLALAKALCFLLNRKESAPFISDEEIIGPLYDAFRKAMAARDVETAINSLCGTLKSVMRGIASFEGELLETDGRRRTPRVEAEAIEVAKKLLFEARQRPHKRAIIKELEQRGYRFANNRRANWKAVFIRAGLSNLPW